MTVLRVLLEITIYSGVLFLFIILFRAIFKKHASPAMLYAAWLLLAIRLVIPVTIGGISLIVLPAQEASVQEQQSGLSALMEDNSGEASTSPQMPAVIAGEPETAARAVSWKWDWDTALTVLWIAGAGIVLLNMAIATAKLNKRLNSAPRLPDKWHHAALLIQDELGIRSRIRYVTMQGFTSPALSASLRPTIVIPMELLWENGRSIEFALRHELTHVKRRDHIVCLLLMLFKAIYWFNPVIWLASRLMRMDMETACDSRVVSVMDRTEKKQYASTVLGMYAKPQPRSVLGMALGHTRQTAERRVRGIFMRQRSARGTKAAALLLAAVMVVACFTTALQPVRAASPASINTGSPERLAEENNSISESQEPATAADSDYTVEDHGSYVCITKFTGFANTLVIPSEIGGKVVKGIKFSAFFGSNATSAVIPASIVYIEDNVFSGVPLTNITVDPANTHFKSQDGILYSYDMTELVSYPGLKRDAYVMPASVNKIGRFAFNCSSPTSITLSDYVTGLNSDGNEFYTCFDLVSFQVNPTNPNYECEDGVLYNKGKTVLIAYPPGKPAASFTVPDSVTALGPGAFHACVLLESITIPNSVKSIGISAFSCCNGLSTLTIPEGVTKIDTYTFYSCRNLTSVNLPEGVMSIGDSSFARCEKLTSVNIPESVITIGGGAFSNCFSLKEVTIPSGVTTIGGGAFSDCSSLNEIAIPSGVTNIGGGAFSNCSGIKEFTIPAGVTELYGVFYGCTSLTKVIFMGDMPQLETGAFKDTPLGFKAYYPVSRAESWARICDFPKESY